MSQRRIVLIVHDVRSAHNVGSLLRTADGLGIECVYFTGYTPYPEAKSDKRLPHISKKLNDQISKTALGAEKSVAWHHKPELADLIKLLKKQGYLIVALEQTLCSKTLHDYQGKEDIALLVGSEIGGLNPKILKDTDLQLEIPMLGKKESFNVSVAAAIALYHLRHLS